MSWRYLKEIFAEPPQSFGVQQTGWKKAYDKLAAAGELPELTRKPRLATVTKAPSRDAFDAWREHPVTLFVFMALRNAASEQQEAWSDTSWQGGTADQRALDEYRCRADAYRAIEEGGYEAFCEWAGIEAQDDVG